MANPAGVVLAAAAATGGVVRVISAAEPETAVQTCVPAAYARSRVSAKQSTAPAADLAAT